MWTLQQLSQRVKQAVEGVAEFRDIRIDGEVIKPFQAASGHLYFTLTDGQNSLACVAWASNQAGFTAQPQEGIKSLLVDLSQLMARGHNTNSTCGVYALLVRVTALLLLRR